MVTKVIGDWSEEMLLKALISNPVFQGEIGLSATRVSETELGLLDGASEGGNKLQIGDILIQWGHETSGFSGGAKTVVFPTAYTVSPIVVVNCAEHDTNPLWGYSVGAYLTSITQFTIQNRVIQDSGAGATDIYDVDEEVFWIAIGVNTA